jgi:Holliday junction resolvasome RuvABC endonuclease subunit
VRTGTITTDKLRGPHRLFYIQQQLHRILAEATPDMVALEGYALGGFQKGKSRLADLGELGGVIRLTLWTAGIDYLAIGPTMLKSIIADAGNAKKEAVRVAIRAKFRLDLPNDDEADAFALMIAGEARLGRTHAMLSTTRLAKLMDTPVQAGQRRFPLFLKSSSPK